MAESAESKKEALSEEERLKLAEKLISDLENNGPGHLVHILAWTTASNSKDIRILSATGKVREQLGKKENEDPLDIEFHRPSSSDEIGHYSLVGNEDPKVDVEMKNNCLFEAIGALVGRDASEIRAETVQVLRKNIKKIAKKIEDILLFEKYNDNTLMIGGARYIGTSPTDAARILDNSQGVHPHGSGSTGHPRGHASDPSSNRNNVEEYSSSAMKTAFLSKQDQNKVCHIILHNEKAQNAMARLNNGSTSELVTICDWEINPNDRPKAQEFYSGKPASAPGDFKQIKLILMHHRDEYNNPDADVFILTLYPMLR